MTAVIYCALKRKICYLHASPSYGIVLLPAKRELSRHYTTLGELGEMNKPSPKEVCEVIDLVDRAIKCERIKQGIESAPDLVPTGGWEICDRLNIQVYNGEVYIHLPDKTLAFKAKQHTAGECEVFRHGQWIDFLRKKVPELEGKYISSTQPAKTNVEDQDFRPIDDSKYFS